MSLSLWQRLDNYYHITLGYEVGFVNKVKKTFKNFGKNTSYKVMCVFITILSERMIVKLEKKLSPYCGRMTRHKYQFFITVLYNLCGNKRNKITAKKNLNKRGRGYTQKEMENLLKIQKEMEK